MSQIGYSINIPAVSYPGQVADNGYKDVLSALAVAAPMIYGTLAVTDETNTLGFDQLACRAPNASTDLSVVGAQLGLVLADQGRAQDPTNANNPQYPLNAAVPCLRKGRAWVYAETAMVDGSNPFIRFATGAGGTVLGSFRNSADTATAAQLTAGFAVVRGTTTGPGYCVIEFDLV
jgi:hypothetical protein